MMLDLGEELFDWIEIRGIFGEEKEPGTGCADGLANSFALVAAQIVHDHDIAGLKGRHKHLFDIDEEAFAVDGAVEQPRCLDAVVAQGGDEGRGLPVPKRHLRLQPLAFGRPAAERRHIRFGPGLVDENQPAGIDQSPIFDPLQSAAGDIWAIPLTGDQRLFLYDSFSACTNSHTER